MNCKNCGKEIESDSIFCEYCGKKVEHESEAVNEDDETEAVEMDEEKEEPKEVVKKEPKKEKVSLPQIFDDIKNHMEFMGYEFNEPTIEESGVVAVLCKHPSRSNIFVQYFPSFGFTFVANYRLEKPSSAEKKNNLLKCVNTFNGQALITGFGINSDFDGIYCSSWYPSLYNKQQFSRFIELFENEIQKKLQSDEFKEFT